MKRTSAKAVQRGTVSQTTESTANLLEQIRLRAYELYEQRGREDGRDLDDWLQAESEVKQQKAMKVPA